MATLSSKVTPSGVATAAQGTLADSAVQPNDSPTFGGLTVDTNTLFVDSANNRVGIGTTSPDVELDVTGDMVVGTSGTEGGQVTLRNPDGTSEGGTLDVSSANNLRLFQTVNNSTMQIGQLGGTGGTVTFSTSGAERMRIDAVGHVGIGTSSPAQVLHVQDSGTNAAGTIQMGTDYHGYVQQLNNNLNIISNGDQAYRAALGTNNGSGNIVFQTASATTGNTERMRLDSSGRLLLNRTSAGGSGIIDLKVGSGVLDVGATIQAASNGNWAIAFKNTANTVVGQIAINAASTAYNTSSDYRLKTDAQPMTGASARVQALKPVNFEWIADGSRVDGFLAHEAQDVVPEAVTGEKDAMRDEEYEVTPAVLDDDGNVVTEAVMGTRSVPEYQGIDQSKLVPLLTAALQEALTKIEALEARLVALEAG